MSEQNETCVEKMELAEGEFAMKIRDAPPAHLLVEIQPLSRTLMRGIKQHESTVHDDGCFKWILTISSIPDGCGCKNEADRVSVYLSLVGVESLREGWSVTADCYIFLHNQIKHNYFCYGVKSRRFDANNSKWGIFICKSMLTEPYVIDDKCVFGAEVFSNKTWTIDRLSSLEWTISNFSKLQGHWSSEEFTVGGFKWMINLYPNGYGDAMGKNISICLKSVDHKSFAPREKVTVDFCIRLRNYVSRAHCTKRTWHLFTLKEGCSRYLNFIPISDMAKGYILMTVVF